MRKAVILCAGEGTRLRPLTERCPKVMLPIAGKPVLEHHLALFKRHGVVEIYINLHHLPEQIVSYFQDGRRFGVRITYSYEEELRGTAGALRGFRDRLNETFAVHYGDVMSELDITKMLAFHKGKGSVATLVVHPTNRPHDSDIVVLDASGRVTAVYHKPGSAKYGNLGNAAFYILEPKVLEYLPQEGTSDFIQDIFPQMIKDGEPLYGYLTDDYLEDMGTLERYEKIKRRYEGK